MTTVACRAAAVKMTMMNVFFWHNSNTNFVINPMVCHKFAKYGQVIRKFCVIKSIL